MVMHIPINFDYAVTITYFDGSTEVSSCFPGQRGIISCTFPKINGYDACGNRVTNLVGYNGVDLIKRCPKCLSDKIVTEFGYDGRYTNRRRDQSECTDCRGQY